MGLPGHMPRIKKHVNSDTHIRMLKQHKENGKNQLSIRKQVQHKSIAVDRDILCFRQNFLEVCACDGIPLTTVCDPDSAFRQLLEAEGHSLVEGRQMKKDHELDALENCVQESRALVQNNPYSVIVDGTSHHGSVDVLIVRCVIDGVRDFVFVALYV